MSVIKSPLRSFSITFILTVLIPSAFAVFMKFKKKVSFFSIQLLFYLNSTSISNGSLV